MAQVFASFAFRMSRGSIGKHGVFAVSFVVRQGSSWTFDVPQGYLDQQGSDAEAKPLYPYLFELKNILAESGELAMQNSSAASQRNKKYYDKKTQDRKFSVGEEVLVLLPSASNKLLSSWLDPFPITKVFHPDYRVLVKGKESSMLTCSKDMFGVRRLQMLLLVVQSV